MSPLARLWRIKLALACDPDSRLRRDLRHWAVHAAEFWAVQVIGWGLVFGMVAILAWLSTLG